MLYYPTFSLNLTAALHILQSFLFLNSVAEHFPRLLNLTKPSLWSSLKINIAWIGSGINSWVIQATHELKFDDFLLRAMNKICNATWSEEVKTYNTNYQINLYLDVQLIWSYRVGSFLFMLLTISSVFVCSTRKCLPFSPNFICLIYKADEGY